MGTGKSFVLDPELRDVISQIQNTVIDAEKSVQLFRYTVTNVVNTMDQIATNILAYATPVETLLKFVRHVHYAHIHGCCHKYDQFGPGDENDQTVLFTPRTRPNPCPVYEIQEATDTESSNTSPAQSLSLEFTQKRDMDENNLIYGYDFVITPSDRNQPPMVRHLTRRVPNFLSKPMISWQAYLDTTPSHMIWKDGYGW